MDVIYDEIMRKGQELTAVERTVIEFILSAEEIESLKLKHIRSQLFVSNATIIRACKKLNYATFNELKYTVVHYRKNKQSFSAAMGLSPLEKMQKEFVVLLTRSMENAAQEVCQLLLSANCVHCSGVAVGMEVANAFVQKQNEQKQAIQTDYLFVPIHQLISEEHANRAVLLFGISQQRNQLMPVIQQLKQFGIKVGLITEQLISADAGENVTTAAKTCEPFVSSPELRLAILSTLIYEMTYQVTV